jgi:type IV fimbrial biogenesis protein FimT
MLLAPVISVLFESYEMKQLFREALPVANTNHKHSARGFTIIELITIMAVLAILLTVGIPAYMNWMPDINLRSAVRDIKSDIELAKSTAIRQNTNCALVFDTTTTPDSYTVFLDNVTTNLVQDGGETLLKSVNMPKNVTMTGASFDGGTAVGFNSRGIPYRYDSGPPAQILDLAGPGTVSLQNINNNYRRVRIAIVGTAKVQISSDGVTWQDD